MFCSKRFVVYLAPVFIYIFALFWVNFYTWCECRGLTLFFWIWMSHCPSTIFWKNFPLTNSFDILVKNQLTISMNIYFWTPNSILFISMSILMLVLPAKFFTCIISFYSLLPSTFLSYCNSLCCNDLFKCASSSSLWALRVGPIYFLVYLCILGSEHVSQKVSLTNDSHTRYD